MFDKTNNSTVDIGNNIVAIRRYGAVDIQIRVIKEDVKVENIRVAEHIGDIVEVANDTGSVKQ